MFFRCRGWSVLVLIIAFMLFVLHPVAQDGSGDTLAMNWSPDGQMLAVGVLDSTMGIQLFARDGSFIQSVATSGSASSVSWSYDGSQFAAYVGDGAYQIFDATTNTVILAFEQIGGTNDYSVYWHPANNGQVVTILGGSVFVRDTTTGAIISSLVSPGTNSDSIISLIWYDNGNQIITASEDNVLRVWDVANTSITAQYQQPFEMISMALTINGTEIAVGDDNATVHIIDISTGTTTSSFSIPASSRLGEVVDHIEWHINQNKIATATYENITIWDRSTEQIINVIPVNQQDFRPNAMDYAPDGTLSYVSSTGIQYAPVAQAGADQTLSDSYGDGTENVVLDGSASSDSDGMIISYEWSENGIVIARGINPQVNLSAGVHQIILSVTDDDGAIGGDVVTITVEMP